MSVQLKKVCADLYELTDRKCGPNKKAFNGNNRKDYKLPREGD